MRCTNQAKTLRRLAAFLSLPAVLLGGLGVAEAAEEIQSG